MKELNFMGHIMKKRKEGLVNLTHKENIGGKMGGGKHQQTDGRIETGE